MSRQREPTLSSTKNANILVFEDAPVGVESAILAGCDCIKVGGISNKLDITCIKDFNELAFL